MYIDSILAFTYPRYVLLIWYEIKASHYGARYCFLRQVHQICKRCGLKMVCMVSVKYFDCGVWSTSLIIINVHSSFMMQYTIWIHLSIVYFIRFDYFAKTWPKVQLVTQNILSFEEKYKSHKQHDLFPNIQDLLFNNFSRLTLALGMLLSIRTAFL